jgi:uncharacterized membrane protein YphA (DoxX/SURF4 family)
MKMINTHKYFTMNLTLKNNPLFSDVISGLFILLFSYAAISKLSDFQRFQVELGKSPLLAPFVNWIIWLIPTFEILIAVFLVVKKLQLAALYAAFSLMVIFTAYIITILNFSEYIPCSCGGLLQHMSWQQHLIFNLVFIGLGCLGVLFYPYQKRTIAIEGEAENLKQSRH